MPVINWVIRFFALGLLILFQVLVLNALNVSPYIHPYVYPMFLLAVPFDTPRWIYLPLAFGVGLLIDMFTNTPGMHAAACVFIAYIRPWVIKIFTPVTGYENVNLPSIGELGFVWFLLFTVTLIFIHHLVYYLLFIFSNSHYIGYAVLNAITSTIVSTLLIVILAYLFTPRKAKR